MRKCRACLKDEGNMVPFSEQHIYYFKLLTDIRVQVCDKLPPYLCLCCFEKMKSFIEFREKCILSNYVLIESSESKHKIDIDVKEYMSDAISTNSKNEPIKMELNTDNIDEIVDDIVDENKQLNYDSLNDLKPENIEVSEQIRTSKRKGVTKKKSKRKISPINIFCELESKSERKIKSSKKMSFKNKETLLSCGLCSQTFPEMSPLTIHLSSHKATNKCDLCSQQFAEWPAFLSHRLIHLTNKEKRCHICLNRFYKPLNLEYHYKKFHTEDKEEYIVKCSECSHTFKSPRKLQKHMWSSHSEKTFHCEHCPKVFKSKHAIKTHMPIHNTKHHLLCDLCNYTSRFSSNLKDHILRKHTPKKTYCKKCTRVFSNQEKLDAHKCEEKGTICPICGKIGKTHRQLVRHMACHDSVARYACARCPKVYRSRTALATHALTHTGHRNKHCDLCGAAFYSASVLIKHRRIHTGEKPYVCRVCSRGFTGNYNLKVHMRVHGEYLIDKRKTDVNTDDK